jgi:predicted O-methyltransferase YrrM
MLKGVPINEKMHQYIVDTFAEEDEILKSLIRESESKGFPQIQITPDSGKLLHILIKMINAKNILEIGTLTGYSAIWMARALPKEGKLITLELETKHADLAGKYFKKAGLENIVEIKIGTALDSLNDLKNELFDFVFIDADKVNYPNYFNKVIPLLKPGSIIAADNTLRFGEIINEDSSDEGTIQTRKFNKMLSEDSRFISLLLSISDGITIGLYTG